MQLDPIGALFAKSWKGYQERFSVLAPIILLPTVILCIGQLLLVQGTLPALALGVLLNLLGVILSIPASIAMVAAIGKNENITQAYQTGFKLFWASIWIALMVALAYFGGLVLLIIPGIMLAIQLTLVQYVLVIDDKRGMAALVQSREYMKGYWWAYVGRMFLVGLVYMAVMLVLYLPFVIILGKDSLIAPLIYFVLLILLTPFAIVYNYEVFQNLRRLKPDVVAAAAKAETGFLKVCMVVGVVGIIGFLFFLGFVFTVLLPAAISHHHDGYPSGPVDYYGDYTDIGTSTLPYDDSSTYPEVTPQENAQVQNSIY